MDSCGCDMQQKHLSCVWNHREVLPQRYNEKLEEIKSKVDNEVTPIFDDKLKALIYELITLTNEWKNAESQLRYVDICVLLHLVP